MRLISASSENLAERAILRVVQLADLPREWSADLLFLVSISTPEALAELSRLFLAGLTNLVLLTTQDGIASQYSHAKMILEDGALDVGDVVACLPSQRQVQILFRKSDIHHTVFLTNRCNSNCLMCSQPPTRQVDDWLIDEAKLFAAHLPISPPIIGFTGGEPLLLGTAFKQILDCFSDFHPSSQFEVLTNGRLFSEPSLAAELLTDIRPNVTWMIPLYGHADFIHDFIVQTHGAFEETIEGLLALQSFRQLIQLRIVLIKPVLEVLPELCDFIAYNLPFVKEVAIMGCEPTGFALANADLCQVDIADWAEQLEEGVSRLHRHRIPVLLMNLPHCAIPSKLWPIAHQSISDWKQVYVDDCEGCDLQHQCAGLFVWSDNVGWRPTKLRKIKGIELS